MQRLVALVLLLSAAAGCTPTNTLRFQDLHIVLSPGSAHAMYGTIHNGSATSLTLDRVESERFGRIEMHQSIVTEDRMRMERIDSIRLPSSGAVKLEPGGLHIMLFEEKSPLSAGNIVPLKIYVNGTPHSVEALVRDRQ